ncbi:hypothetical protein Tco_0495933 [Tanacetum coccineum]
MRKPLFNLTLDILKQHTLYNALTLTTDALEITCNNHAEVIEESVKANVLNEVKNKLPKKFELNEKLYEMMFQSTSYLTHDAHRELYNALSESIRIDALQSRYESAQTSRKKQSYDDQDPPKNSEGEKKKKRSKGARESSSKKALAESTNFEIFAAANEPRQE